MSHDDDGWLSSLLHTWRTAHGGSEDPAERTRQALCLPLTPGYAGGELPPPASIVRFLREALPEVPPAVLQAEASSLAGTYVSSGAPAMVAMGQVLAEVARLLAP